MLSMPSTCNRLELEFGVKIKLIQIPREIMEKNRTSPPPFLEVATLEAEPVIREVGDHSVLTGAWVTTNSALPIAISGTIFPDLEFCVREAGGDLFILACKREGATVQAVFSGLPPGAGRGEVMFEPPRAVEAPQPPQGKYRLPDR